MPSLRLEVRGLRPVTLDVCPDPRHTAAAAHTGTTVASSGSVTLLAAIVTLIARTATAAGPLAPMDCAESIDRVALPAVPGPVRLEVRALDRSVLIEAPRGARALAAAIRRAPRTLCEGVEVAGPEVRLHCRSPRIVARIAAHARGSTLEVTAVRALPWMGPDAPPLVAYDPPVVHLGGACPGSTAPARAECLLAGGDLAGARRALGEVVEGPPLAHASLRLGDLDLLEGDLHGAARRWREVRGAPWERLAAIRLHELSPASITIREHEALYSTADLPPPLAREVTLREARGLAFDGQLLAAVRLLESADCAGVRVCVDILTLAMRARGPASIEALAVWAELSDRGSGPTALEAERAAAEVAAREGAPAFAASVLAGAVAHVPAAALPAHLLRTAELFLEASDTVRAGVVLDFARARIGGRHLAGPKWASVIRSVRTGAPGADGAGRPGSSEVEARVALAAAERAAGAARALTSGGKP